MAGDRCPSDRGNAGASHLGGLSRATYDCCMPPSEEHRQRARLARALAEFWSGGAGPTHGELTDVFDMFGLQPEEGNKRDRVSEAVKSADTNDIAPLVIELVDLLRAASVFSPESMWAASEDHVARLREALLPFGLRLDDGGRIKITQGLVADAATLPDEPALREHVQRMQLALQEGDTALLIGSSKELLETTAKVVLARAGEPEPSKFPALVGRALEVLKLHPKSEATLREDLVEPVRKILGGVLQIALGVNELRNERGTGHGKVEPALTLGDRHARLAAGASVVVATLMLDTLEDEAAPWRRRDE